MVSNPAVSDTTLIKIKMYTINNHNMGWATMCTAAIGQTSCWSLLLLIQFIKMNVLLIMMRKYIKFINIVDLYYVL